MRPFKALLIACAYTIIFANLASAQPFGEKRAYFKDWLAACRPTTGYCSATTYINPNPPSGAVADYILRVSREKSADNWEISLSTVVTLPTDTSFVVIEDEPNMLYFNRPGSFAAFGAINDFYFLGNEARHLLNKMLANDTLTLTFDAETGRETLDFSLRGLTASMLWIDEQQEKVGSKRDAGYGPRAERLAIELAPPPKDIPQTILDMHLIENGCDFAPDSSMFSSWESMALNQNFSLFMLPCSAGAYNLISRFYVWNNAQQTAEQQNFVAYSDTNGWTSTPDLVNAFLDPHSRTVTSFSKSRGLGDCGTAGTWQWAGYGIQLRQYYYQPICGLDYGEDADLTFPQIFPKAE
jgi:hypothetical protein